MMQHVCPGPASPKRRSPRLRWNPDHSPRTVKGPPAPSITYDLEPRLVQGRNRVIIEGMPRRHPDPRLESFFPKKANPFCDSLLLDSVRMSGEFALRPPRNQSLFIRIE